MGQLTVNTNVRLSDRHFDDERFNKVVIRNRIKSSVATMLGCNISAIKERSLHSLFIRGDIGGITLGDFPQQYKQEYNILTIAAGNTQSLVTFANRAVCSFSIGPFSPAGGVGWANKIYTIDVRDSSYPALVNKERMMTMWEYTKFVSNHNLVIIKMSGAGLADHVYFHIISLY